MDVLAVALWVTAAGGVLSVVVASVRPKRRRAAFFLAGVLFLPIGILGILSVGVAFLVAAAVCIVSAVLSPPLNADAERSS